MANTWGYNLYKRGYQGCFEADLESLLKTMFPFERLHDCGLECLEKTTKATLKTALVITQKSYLDPNYKPFL